MFSRQNWADVRSGSWVLAAVALLLPALMVAGSDRPRLEREVRTPSHQLPAEAELPAGAVHSLGQVYDSYQRLIGQAGGDLSLRLHSTRTVLPRQYDNHGWLDLMSPPTGWWLNQRETYYEAPWLGEQQVSYALEWRERDLDTDAKTFEILGVLQDWTIQDAVTWLLEEGKLERPPVAITTYRVEASFAGRDRSYRAAAFWFQAADVEDLELTIQDHVIPYVASAQVEEARVVLRQELGLRRQHPGVPHAVAAVTSGSCIAETIRRKNAHLEAMSIQGHSTGHHIAQFGLQADCIADAGCYNQCRPLIWRKTCAESSNSSYPSLCRRHETKYSEKIAGGSSQGSTATCVGALACGVRACCTMYCSGVISLSFSGSGGSLTGSASSTGSADVYDMSISDQVTCPAPREEQQDPCASQFSSSGGSGSEGGLGLVTDAIFIPCDDGGGGAGDPSSGQDEPDPGSGTPILLDLGRGGLELTDAGGGVDFDLDADGIVERISWTTAGTDDAFLVLDRDDNGTIDHGGELFGDSTPQPDPGAGAQRHGFIALAVFDTAGEGGNGDGSITPADAVFDRLELWRDADHDGVSDPGELTSLAAEGVVSLGLDYVENRSRDRHGNELRYRGHCQWTGPAGNAHTKPLIDVIFIQQ